MRDAVMMRYHPGFYAVGTRTAVRMIAAGAVLLHVVKATSEMILPKVVSREVG